MATANGEVNPTPGGSGLRRPGIIGAGGLLGAGNPGGRTFAQVVSPRVGAPAPPVTDNDRFDRDSEQAEIIIPPYYYDIFIQNQLEYTSHSVQWLPNFEE